MHITSLLEKVVNGEYDFCGICYKQTEDEKVNVDDEVILQERNYQKTLQISEIIFCVLGDEVINNVSAFQMICQQCAASLVHSYKFIKFAQENAKYSATAIENLAQCFDLSEVPEDMEECDTLFVTLNPEDVTIGPQYFDSLGPIYSKHEALEKFLVTADLLIVKKEEKILQQKVKCDNSQKVVKYGTPKKKNISTVDMVYNGDMSVLNCKDCLREFQTVSNLRNHFLRVHAPKVFKCSQCPKSFGTKSFLKAHEAESHINIVCSECGKTFTNIQTFKTHEKTHYMKIICPDCGRVYKNQNTYKQHIDNKVCQTAVRHSPSEAKFTCDYCGKKYTQKVSLRVHIQYEHLNYKYLHCKWCEKKFWCQARLKAHIVTHTKEKNFICTTCNGKFVTRESLLYHTRIHTGERPYPCPLCDSRFLSASRRQAHMKSQHINPSVECDICHAKFKSINHLVKHKQLHESPKSVGQKLLHNTTKVHVNSQTKTSKTDFDADYDQNKPIIVQKSIKHENIEEQKMVYRIIGDDDNVYEIQTDHNEGRETVYLEMSEDGQYKIKVPIDHEVLTTTN